MFSRFHNVFNCRKYDFPKAYVINNMSSKKSKAKTTKNTSKPTPKEQVENTPISYDSSNNILIKILAKPGAKQNSVTDISEEGIGIQINASPVEGQANTELLKYIATVTGVKKGDITLVKGGKSRQKTVSIRSGVIEITEALEKFRLNQESK